MNLTFPVARYGVGLSFREVFGIEFCDTPQLAAGSFIRFRLCERAVRRCRGIDNTLLDIPSQTSFWRTVADTPGLASLRRSTLKCRSE